MSPELEELFTAFEDLFGAQRRQRGRGARSVDGISLAQSRLVRVLARDGAMPVGKLASGLGISAAAVTQMLDGLEQRELVERLRCGEDRRVITISLTDAGRGRAEESRDRHRLKFEAAMEGLPETEVSVGVDVLLRCAAYFDAL
jgi:DNA-binding MarR family transcriptional regulator